jgi:hypothetical protein
MKVAGREVHTVREGHKGSEVGIVSSSKHAHETH